MNKQERKMPMKVNNKLKINRSKEKLLKIKKLLNKINKLETNSNKSLRMRMNNKSMIKKMNTKMERTTNNCC